MHKEGSIELGSFPVVPTGASPFLMTSVLPRAAAEGDVAEDDRSHRTGATRAGRMATRFALLAKESLNSARGSKRLARNNVTLDRISF